MPAIVKVAAVPAPRVQAVGIVTTTVLTVVAVFAAETAVHVPAKPVTVATVGTAGTVKAKGSTTVTVPPAVNAEAGVKPTVQVEVAFPTAEAGATETALTAAAPAKVVTPRRAMDMTINTAANLFTCLMGLKRDVASRPSVE
jgi:hypothetical protein